VGEECAAILKGDNVGCTMLTFTTVVYLVSQTL